MHRKFANSRLIAKRIRGPIVPPMPNPIQFRNRYTGQLQTEEIYGEGSLRFVYENPLGKIALWAAAKRAWFSHYYGRRMDQAKSAAKVLPFIEEFGVDPGEFLDSPESFQSFNEFFFRKLKPEARPISPRPGVVVFPADGRHLGFPDLSKTSGIFAKGQMLALDELLGSTELAARYADGSGIISRLCPVDYHRFHFPVSGTAGEAQLINGNLCSVNPIALRRNLAILWRNKRTLTEIESPEFGNVLMLEIGATCVGGTIQTYQSGQEISKGDEKGYFKFGGSMTISLFEKGRVKLSDDLARTGQDQIEMYAKMGDGMATIKP